ncbi:MAG TPA: DUF411 domain-containing protein [Methylomirabilota bacterium]|nr:DUF411 domain-containing protein [Methylomirabilota bacterium]
MTTRRGVLVGAMTLALATAGARLGRAVAKSPIVVHKSPTCGCCGAWVEHLRGSGYVATVQDVEDLTPIKRKLGVPRALQSCHTAVVEGYVVEGHVPADLIDRLLAERPTVVGIAVPGMPIGSPGMEVPGQAAERYQVLAFDRKGRATVFASR